MTAGRWLLAAWLIPVAALAQVKVAPGPVLPQVPVTAGPLATAVAPNPTPALALPPAAAPLAPAGKLQVVARALGLAKREPLAPPTIQVARSLVAAGANEASPSRSLEALTAVFDGLAEAQKARVLDDLESTVKTFPKDAGLRHAYLGLLVRDELATVEPKLRGVELTRARREDVLAKTRIQETRWWHRFVPGIEYPEAEGVAKPDGTIHLHVRGGWRKLPNLAAHFRTIFSHEYAHRLQYEGVFDFRFHAEPTAVATELLRMIELAGVKGLETLSHEGLLSLFRGGREWAAAPLEGRRQTDGFFFKGFAAGVAYELAQATGRWADAWTYHRRVSSGEDPLAVEAELRRATPGK